MVIIIEKQCANLTPILYSCKVPVRIRSKMSFWLTYSESRQPKKTKINIAILISGIMKFSSRFALYYTVR